MFRAVLANLPTTLQDFTLRFEAVDQFIQLPEAVDLIEIYKRIRNILDKANPAPDIKFNLKLAQEPAEHTLGTMAIKETKIVSDLYKNQKYFEVFASLIKLKQPLHEFFEKIMVMVDDKQLRDNRLALLTKIQKLFMLIADLSYIVSGNKSNL